MNRRTFLKGTAAAAAASFIRPGGLLAQAVPDVQITLNPAQPGATISPHIYGHFIEHLGGVIYDGIWVGKDSRIPNVNGIRKAFVDDMKAIAAPNLRWPGGCFADGYHWRDGIGPAEKRARTYNYWISMTPQGPQRVETNQFGTHEFINLCRLTGATPYLAANVGSGTAQEFHDWYSYCNAPAGSINLADERAANGDRDPFNVVYWGVGNESWGCGGNMTGQEYSQEYRKFATQVPNWGQQPYLIATGPRGHSADHDLGWTRGFFEGMRGGRGARVDGFSLHFYTDFRQTQFSASRFPPSQWYSVLLKGLVLEKAINENWAIMGEFDPQHRTRFIVDEWGNWYPRGQEIVEGFTISQPITLRDALHTAMHFDIFQRHADKVAMANVAQTINCLHSLFLAHEDKYTRTPVYYVFQMYMPHMNARTIPIQIDAPELNVTAEEGPTKMAGLYGSASVKEGQVTVSLTNPSLDAPMNARIRLDGTGRITEARGRILTHADYQAGGTLQNPDTVKPADLAVTVADGAMRVTLPKQSVATIELRVA